MSRRACLLAASMFIFFASGCAVVDLDVSVSGPAEEQPVASATKAAEPAGSAKSELARVHSHWAYFRTRTSPAILKKIIAPKAEAVYCGTLRGLADGDRTCCLTRATKDGAWGSLVIDLDDNKDLTDDAALTLPAPGAERMVTITHNGTAHTFVLRFLPPKKNYVNLTLSPTCGRKGIATVGGAEVKWAVADCNLSGSVDAGDTAHLDLDGDGSLAARRDGGVIVLKPSSAVCREGKWYGVSPDAAGTGIDMAPYAGDMHTLVLDCTKIPGGAKAPRELTVIYGDGKRAGLKDIDARAGVKLPAGALRHAWGSLPASPKPVRFTVRNLKLDKDLTLTLEPPTARINVQQKDGKIHVSQRCVAPQGVSYTLARGKPGPLVEVFKADDLTAPVAKGNMAYG